MTEVSTLLDGVVQGLIEDLNEASHTGKVFVHLSSSWKVAARERGAVDVIIFTLLDRQYHIILCMSFEKQA